MRAFRYRLGAVLKGAEQMEQVRQVTLARAEEALQEAARRMRAIRAAQEGVQRRLRTLHREEVDVARAHGLVQEVERMGELLEEAGRLKRELEGGVVMARGRLLEAARERRKFESHRDELAVRHRRAEQSHENKQLDDIATQRFSAPGRGGAAR